MKNLIIRTPKSKKEFEAYSHFRWENLRKPLKMPIESMFDDLEKSSIHLIAVIAQRIVAAGRVHFNSSDQAQIRFMCVDKDFRREGLGSKILSELEKHALKGGCSEVMLNARDIAMKFYLSSGYKKIKTYNSETGLPHTQMKKIF